MRSPFPGMDPYLESPVTGHWVELDLLRDGVPTIQTPDRAATAYCAYLDRANPTARQQLVCPISLRHRLPKLSVPVHPDGPDVQLDLQAALDSAYDRARYDADTDYSRAPVPALNTDDATWADSVLRDRGVLS